jgi:hypothetical protein
VKGSLVTCFPMTDSMWVTWDNKAVLSHPFLWTTASEWHGTCCERQSHHMFSYDQQGVSDIAHVVKGILITCFGMTNSQWVTLDILWKAGPITCFHKQYVRDIKHFVKGSLFTSFPMTNSMWVTLTFCKRQSYHMFYSGQQEVSDIGQFCERKSPYLWLTGSG